MQYKKESQERLVRSSFKWFEVVTNFILFLLFWFILYLLFVCLFCGLLRGYLQFEIYRSRKMAHFSHEYYPEHICINRPFRARYNTIGSDKLAFCSYAAPIILLCCLFFWNSATIKNNNNKKKTKKDIYNWIDFPSVFVSSLLFFLIFFSLLRTEPRHLNKTISQSCSNVIVIINSSRRLLLLLLIANIIKRNFSRHQIKWTVFVLSSKSW